MGRRRKRRRIIKPKRVERKILECPRCGARTLSIYMDYKEGLAYITCGSCKLSKRIKISRMDTKYDALAYLIDILEDAERGVINPRDADAELESKLKELKVKKENSQKATETPEKPEEEKKSNEQEEERDEKKEEEDLLGADEDYYEDDEYTLI